MILAGYNLWGHKELDTTGQLTLASFQTWLEHSPFPQPLLSASFRLSPDREAVSLMLVISFDSDHILTFMIIIHRSLSQRQGPCLSSLAYVR